MNFMNDLRDRAAKRQAYKATVNTLRHLPLSTALDLDIFPGDAERIARRAVYGI